MSSSKRVLRIAPEGESHRLHPGEGPRVVTRNLSTAFGQAMLAVMRGANARSPAAPLCAFTST
jgi:hypothetical protein